MKGEVQPCLQGRLHVSQMKGDNRAPGHAARNNATSRKGSGDGNQPTGDIRVSQRPRGRNMLFLSGMFTQTGPRKACASGGGGAGTLILLVVRLTEVMLMVMVLIMTVAMMVAVMVMAVLEVTMAMEGVMPMDSS